MALVQEAIALQPNYWNAYDIMMNMKMVLGDEEGAWTMGQNLRKVAGGRPGRAPEITYEIVDWAMWDMPAVLAALTADAASSSGAGTFTFSAGPVVAIAEAFLHDPTAAELALQTTRPDASDPTIVATAHFVRGILAF